MKFNPVFPVINLNLNKLKSLLRNLILLLFLLITNQFAQSQICLELPELNGTPQTYAAPQDWSIWYGTPDIITGNGIYTTGVPATIQDVDQASTAGGEIVFLIINPANGNNTESIQTTLSSLIIGQSYTVNVEWQQATLDYTNFSSRFTGGDLGAYIDGSLIHTFASNGGIDDVWQVATISFTATATSHILGLKGILNNISNRGAIVIDNSYCVSPLPVDLIDFTATEAHLDVLLSWQTKSETNNKSFQIERYTDDNDWQQIAEISGAGTSSNQNNYSFLDQNISSQHIYYRLKQIDFDGKITQSEVIGIDRSEISNDISISVYPNPTSDRLVILGKNIQHFNIINSIGQQINMDGLIESNTKNQLVLDVSRLKNGVYFIKASLEVKRFIKN